MVLRAVVIAVMTAMTAMTWTKTMTAIESLRIYSEAVLTISIRMSFQHTFRENFLCRN